MYRLDNIVINTARENLKIKVAINVLGEEKIRCLKHFSLVEGAANEVKIDTGAANTFILFKFI
mgnify:CR=1 FL=1